MRRGRGPVAHFLQPMLDGHGSNPQNHGVLTGSEISTPPEKARVASYTTCWLVLLAVLAGHGVSELRKQGLPRKIGATGPDGALAHHADFVIQAPGALPALRRTLDPLPAAARLLVFAKPGDDANTLAGQVIQYAAWPRPVEVRKSAPGEGGLTIAEAKKGYAAMFLCGWHAPDQIPGLIKIGPGVEFIPFASAEPR